MTADERQSELLRLARGRAGGGRTPTVHHRSEPGPAPLSHAQQRMWLMDRLGQGGALYNVPVATRLRGPLDLDALATALTGLAARHEVLRTRYGRRDGQPYQEVMATAPVAVPVVEATPDRTAELLRAEAARPFDLAAGPMLRALTVRHGAQDHTLLLTLHHIAVDGGSLPVVAEELAVLYTAALAGRADPLPEPALQYADFARWERERDAELAAGVEHWVERLTGARPVPLPRRAAGTRSRQGRVHSAPLSPQTLDGLRRLGREHGTTLFTVVLAAAFATLRHATGADDLTVGCASGHRARPELRRLVGLCVNTLPVRVDLSGDPAFSELLGRVRSAALTAQEHHEIPFDLVVERLGGAARREDGTPLLSVTGDLVRPPEPLRLAGLSAEAVEVELGLAKFDLGLYVEDGPEPRCLVQHDLDVLGEGAAGLLLTAFAELLAAVASDGGLPLSRLPGGLLPADRPVHPVHPAEAALLADPRVREAVLVERGDLPPLAYAVLNGSASASPTELRWRIRGLLPAQQVPAAVTLLDTLPRTADGAVDRARLPGATAPAAQAPAAGGRHLEAVRAGFADLLGARPAPEDDFFQLGGQSLIAVQLADRLRVRTGLPLTGLDILEQRSPAAVAALLDTREAERLAARPRPSGRPGPAVRSGTVLLTGGTGGVGAAILQELLAQGRPVRALARPESAHLVALDGVEVAEGDLADLDSLRAATAGVDTVIHAACTFTAHEVDVAAMRALVGSWRRGSFVFVSSIDAYGQPTGLRVEEGAAAEQPVTAYGRAKLDCERMLLDAAGRDGRGSGAVVRAPIVWGPHRRLRDQLRWGATGALYQAARAGEQLVLPDPRSAGHDWYGAAWVHSAALARAVVACADGSAAAAGRVVNAVGGHVGWPELAAELARLLGSSAPVELRPDADAELSRPWHYRADALSEQLRARPGEDWQTVLAAMVR